VEIAVLVEAVATLQVAANGYSSGIGDKNNRMIAFNSPVFPERTS